MTTVYNAPVRIIYSKSPQFVAFFAIFLLTVRDGEKNNYKEGLVTHDGTGVLPAQYKHMRWYKNNRVLCNSEGDCENDGTYF